MSKDKLDKLDLALAEIEAKRLYNKKMEVLKSCLEDCMKTHPDCPYIYNDDICKPIAEALEDIPEILSESYENN